jgi:hypothetical protein
MTQVARPETVLGKFDGTTIDSDGLAYKVLRENGAFLAEMPDPDVMMYVVQGGRKIPFSQVPRVRLPVVMTTGSHHYQTYWVASKRYEGLLQTVPLVYLIADQRWVPREAAFLRGPGDEGRMVTQWNHHCIRCHSTGGNPGLDDTGMLRSKVAELGIACEACHGPGQPHVQKQRALLSASNRGHGGSGQVDRQSVPPRPPAPSQVCGQCHGVYHARRVCDALCSRGPLFRREDLHRTRYYVQHPHASSSQEHEEI